MKIEDLPNEQWKPVEDTGETYFVSNMGRVKRIATEELITDVKDDHKYHIINIRTSDGNTYTTSVHRLVARHFCPNPNGYDVVNHKDENKSNNKADNLEWCTTQYNSTYGTAQERSLSYRSVLKVLRRFTELLEEQVGEMYGKGYFDGFRTGFFAYLYTLSHDDYKNYYCNIEYRKQILSKYLRSINWRRIYKTLREEMPEAFELAKNGDCIKSMIYEIEENEKLNRALGTQFIIGE